MLRGNYVICAVVRPALIILTNVKTIRSCVVSNYRSDFWLWVVLAVWQTYIAFVLLDRTSLLEHIAAQAQEIEELRRTHPVAERP